MSVTETGNRNQTEGASFSTSPVSATIATTAGNAVIVAVSWYIGGGATIILSDSNSNGTPTLLISKAIGNEKVALYLYKVLATGGAGHQFTATPSATSFVSIAITEVSGQDPTTQSGATNSGGNTTGTTTPSAGSITPAVGNLTLAALTHDTSNSPTLTAGTGWTKRSSIQGASGVCLGTETQAGAGSAVTGDWTMGASIINWSAVVAEIQAASGGPAFLAAGPRLIQQAVKRASYF